MLDWTYGAEHEFADWDRRRGLPAGCDLDLRDVTMVNSNGIAVDPRGELYPYGGELRTRPSGEPQGQVTVLREFKALYPEATVNYRSNLHVHVRVHGLRANLAALKRVTSYNLRWLPVMLPLIEPITRPVMDHRHTTRAEFEGEMRRYRRRRRSHQTTLSQKRVAAQLTARTVQEFHDLGVPWSRGKPQPFLQPRPAVNLRQLLETDTIEFRHFPGTLDEEELLTCVEWCRDYTHWALITGEAPVMHYEVSYAKRRWPQFRPYVHWMEERFRATVRGAAPAGELRRRITAYLEEDARARASAVPR